MKSLNLIFQASMLIAVTGWFFLIVLPKANYTDNVVKYIIVALLCLIYIYLLLFQKDIPDQAYPGGSFWTLQGVINIFKNPKVVLTGWVHYLAFDLMVGLFVKNDALLNGIHFGLVIPCLLLTLMYGPVGLFCYFLLRWFYISG